MVDSVTRDSGDFSAGGGVRGLAAQVEYFTVVEWHGKQVREEVAGRGGVRKEKAEGLKG